MIVYGASLSPFVRKVLAFAAAKGMPLELKQVGLGSPDPDFAAASPFRKMPALRDGDFVVADSSAIVTYLEAKQPEPPLIPAEARARARTVWFEEYADTILTPAAARSFFNRLVAPRFLGRDGDLAAAEKAEREEIPLLLDYLEGQVPESRFLVGDRLTLADIAVASPLVNLAHVDYRPDPAKHPRASAYIAAIHALPCFAPLIEREQAFLASA